MSLLATCPQKTKSGKSPTKVFDSSKKHLPPYLLEWAVFSSFQPFLWSIEFWLDFSAVHWALIGLFFGPLSFGWTFLWSIELWLDFSLVHWVLIGLFFGPLSFDWTFLWSNEFWLDFSLVHGVLVGLCFGPLDFCLVNRVLVGLCFGPLDFCLVNRVLVGLCLGQLDFCLVNRVLVGLLFGPSSFHWTLDWSCEVAAHFSASFQRALHELKLSLTWVCLINVSMS